MHQKHKKIQPQRLRFPPQLKFTSIDNRLLECNGKSVQVIPSLPIKPSDTQPADLQIFGIGKYSFNVSDADVIILSFVNSQTQKTDCAIIERDELLARLEPYHLDGDKIKLNLVLSERGLHECYNAGAEAFFMGLWVNDLRDFSKYHNNWKVVER